MVVETKTRAKSISVTSAESSLPKKLLGRFFQTQESGSLVLIRLGLAVTMFPHGAQKALGWFGGMGLSGTLNAFTTFMHIPWILALAVIASEFLGSLALIFGFATRLAAFGIGMTM